MLRGQRDDTTVATNAAAAAAAPNHIADATVDIDVTLYITCVADWLTTLFKARGCKWPRIAIASEITNGYNNFELIQMDEPGS